ncbi:sensor histidine kinase [Actinomyces sp. MRS3W]|uniref:sensor histidine kinase n=1 Tax=Actinomyces sp. MRS3W TaxID=2800796 RepID=UPI0028FDC067|nr:histidine kinase [Actinomyces sp. MRS3W]MDU0347568.1 histidine kinase [Actinomyces sp. MRS3W]
MAATVVPTDIEPRSTSTQCRVRRGVLVLTELLHAAAFLPLVVVAIPLLLAFHLTLPLLAEADRALARLAGVNAPSALPPGRRLAWLRSRVVRAGFWKQDVPLVLGGTLLSAVGFFVAGMGGILTGVLAVGPFIASPEQPLELSLPDLPGWSRTATSFRQVWWLEPIALACLALVLGLLLVLGHLRCRMTVALSRPDDEARLAALAAEVGHLSSGRATLVDAFDAERARIERDLHDGAQQRLVAVAMHLGAAELHADRLETLDPGAAGHLGVKVGGDDSGGADNIVDHQSGQETPDDARIAALAALRADIRTAQDEAEAALRSLRETVHGIRPAILTERGLAPALRDLAGRAPLPTAVSITGGEADLTAITSPVATTVYFAVAEALTNAAKHAGPNAQARVEAAVTDRGLRVIVVDNGAGGADPHSPGSTGLAGMAQRVESIGGHLVINSPPGVGTRLTLTAPLTPPWARG